MRWPVHAVAPCVLLTALLLLLPALSLAESQEEIDAKFEAQLSQLAPAAVADFRAANEALRGGNLARALEGFQKVHQQAPTFAPALRREGYAQSGLGHHTEAVALLEEAKRYDASAAGDEGLARVLLERRQGDDVKQARRLLESAVHKDPKDEEAKLTLCNVELNLKDYEAFGGCAVGAMRDFPQAAHAHFFGALAALGQGDTSLARERLETARTLGLPAESYEKAQGWISESEPFYLRWGPLFLKLLGIWAALFAVLALSGLVLSSLTLAEARKLPSKQTGRAQGGSAALRRAYGAVIFSSIVFYYVSLPLLVLTVLAVGGGLIYAFFVMGRMPIKLVLVIVVLVLVTCWAVLKSLFVRTSDEDPGTRLEPGEAPALRAMLNEVAQRIGTRAVDNVYLTPGTDLAVFERGSFRRKMQGTSERCLILGVGVLDGMTQAQLRSILAHEYGHFSNRDTAGGGLALGVRAGLMKMAVSLAQNGAAAWYNPAWLFFQGYFRVFLRISQGATRLQEVLADRWAAFAYGSESFAEGLSHVIRRSIGFDEHANRTLKEVIDGPRVLANLYAYAPKSAVEGIDAQFDEAMNREPSPYDSHPRPADRIAWVRALGVESPSDESAHAPVWALFPDREALERRMTGEVINNIAVAHGVRIESRGPAAEPAA